MPARGPAFIGSIAAVEKLVERCPWTEPNVASLPLRMHAGDCAGAAAAAADAQNASTGTPVDEAAVTSAQSSAASCGSPGAVLPDK